MIRGIPHAVHNVRLPSRDVRSKLRTYKHIQFLTYCDNVSGRFRRSPPELIQPGRGKGVQVDRTQYVQQTRPKNFTPIAPQLFGSSQLHLFFVKYLPRVTTSRKSDGHGYRERTGKPLLPYRTSLGTCIIATSYCMPRKIK